MQDRTALAKAEFDRWSRSYDRSILQRCLFHPSHQLLLHQLRPDDQQLLDVGCGTGVFLAEALKKFPRLSACGIDLSEKMLEKAVIRGQRWPGRFVAVRGESGQLPFGDNQFDVVTCSHSFHHYPDQRAAMHEMFRVLRPGGRAMIIDGWRDRLWGLLVFDVLVRLAEGPVHHCSARKFRRLFETAGFGQVRQEFRNGLIPFVCTVGQAAKSNLIPAATPQRAA
jgi:SAM-dependent methyltransferase